MKPGVLTSTAKWSNQWLHMSVSLVPESHHDRLFWQMSAQTYWDLCVELRLSKEEFTGWPTLAGIPVLYTKLPTDTVILCVRAVPNRVERFMWETIRRVAYRVASTSARVGFIAQYRRDGYPTS